LKASIYSHLHLIGTADLQVDDSAMGCLFGDFMPNEIYFDAVQKQVWKFGETNKRDYAKWEALGFNARLENGYFLYPAGGYTIDDSPDFPGEAKRIDIAGLDSHVIEDYFLTAPPGIFVEMPWEAITIEQKIAFETELNKELGLDGPAFWVFLKPKQVPHILANIAFSALCTNQCNDEVLFAIRGAEFDNKFAVVHLTWKGKKEVKLHPLTEFYKDFDAFKHSRMYPDKAEWEE
jgi:hypothetical protein